MRRRAGSSPARFNARNGSCMVYVFPVAMPPVISFDLVTLHKVHKTFSVKKQSGVLTDGVSSAPRRRSRQICRCYRGRRATPVFACRASLTSRSDGRAVRVRAGR